MAATDDTATLSRLARLRAIHDHPDTCWRVRPGSVALPLVPALRGDEWSLTSLLALPRSGGRSGRAYDAAWGAVEWRWPAGRPLQLVELARLPDVPRPRPDQASWHSPGSSDDEQAHERALADALALDDEAGLPHLATLCASVLPQGAYPIIWALLPETRRWLDPRRR